MLLWDTPLTVDMSTIVAYDAAVVFDVAGEGAAWQDDIAGDCHAC